MTNFILPNAYFYYDLNNHLIDLHVDRPELFKDKINFIGIANILSDLEIFLQ